VHTRNLCSVNFDFVSMRLLQSRAALMGLLDVLQLSLAGVHSLHGDPTCKLLASVDHRHAQASSMPCS